MARGLWEKMEASLMLDVEVVIVVVVEDGRELEADGGGGVDAVAELLARRESRIGVSTPEPS